MKKKGRVTSMSARMCPKCAARGLVYKTREKTDGSILRYRRCEGCGLLYATEETFQYVVSEKFSQCPDMTDKKENL